ncbi:MAG: HAD family hydrolase [Candidatus Lokiarchaeota archaeon]|nr:HAD family hydrolase [Candidatus Lokiarchaeota archaeon]
MIKAITFDLWNTIFDNRFYSDFRLNFFTLFIEKKQIAYDLQEIENSFKLAFYLPERNYEENDHIYTEDRIAKMLDLLKIDLTELDKELIKNKFEEIMLDDPPSLKIGVKQTLEELSSDYKIGLISNTGITPGRIISKVFQEYEIFQYFDVKIFSDEIGYYKPHKIIFKTALESLKCIPQNAIHIGDNLETDIKGAQDYNMYTVWFNESKSPKSENVQPDYEIHEINEVLQIVQKLG